MWKEKILLIYYRREIIKSMEEAIPMNETSILSRDSYGLVNQLSDWGCFDSKLSASSPVFSKYFNSYISL